MAFINNEYDVTMTPRGEDQRFTALAYSMASAPQGDINQCIAANRIMQGRGDPCMSAMCSCMGGSMARFGCPKMSDTDYAAARRFCGASSTGGFYDNGYYWTVNRNAGISPQALQAARANVAEVDPYTVMGMYGGMLGPLVRNPADPGRGTGCSNML